MIIVRFALAVLLTVVIFGYLTPQDQYAQRGRCGDQTVCVDLFEPRCIPVPTSLPVISSSWSGGLGFRVASQYCGAARCYLFFACRCGPSLGGEGVCFPGSPGVASASDMSCPTDAKDIAKLDE